MVPVTDDGTSTTALSVSSSMTDWPALTLAPFSTIRRTRSPCSMFSPSSGSLNSITALRSPLVSDVELCRPCGTCSVLRVHTARLKACPDTNRFPHALAHLADRRVCFFGVDFEFADGAFYYVRADFLFAG